MNSSPVETFDGAGAIFNWATNVPMLKGVFWVMAAVLVLVVLASIVHEIRVGAKHKRR